MIEVNDIPGAAFEGASVVLLARVAYAGGQPVEASDIAAVSYQIDALDPSHSGAVEPVSGHQGIALPPADVLYDALQTSSEWNLDATGYNFRHEVDVGVAPAFPSAGRTYRVRYELAPVVGQPIVIRFSIRAI